MYRVSSLQNCKSKSHRFQPCAVSFHRHTITHFRVISSSTMKTRAAFQKIVLLLVAINFCAGMTCRARREFFLFKKLPYFQFQVYLSKTNNKFIAYNNNSTHYTIFDTLHRRKRRIIVYGSVTRYGPQSVAQRKWLTTDRRDWRRLECLPPFCEYLRCPSEVQRTVRRGWVDQRTRLGCGAERTNIPS